jgi:ethanolamine utilization protein EutQ
MAERKRSNEVMVWSHDEIQGRYAPTPWGFDRVGVVEKNLSDTLGVSFIKSKNGTKTEWTMKYDEMLYVLKGTQVIHHEGKEFKAGPGDVLFLRRGTPVVYESRGDTEVLCSVYPTWWAEQEGT